MTSLQHVSGMLNENIFIVAHGHVLFSEVVIMIRIVILYDGLALINVCFD